MRGTHWRRTQKVDFTCAVGQMELRFFFLKKKNSARPFFSLRTVLRTMSRVSTLADPEPPSSRVSSKVTHDVTRTATRKQAQHACE